VSVDGRLTKLMPTLSARERAILVLGSFKDKTPEDPSWRSTMPPSQIAEFNGYIKLMDAANIHLGALIALLEQSVEKLALREAWLVTLHLWGEHLIELKAAVDHCLKPPANKTDRKLRRVLELAFDWSSEDGSVNVLVRLEDGLRKTIARCLADCWVEMRATEIVLDEATERLDGVDVLSPRNREPLTRIRTTLLSFKEQFECLGVEYELPEPDEEAVDLVREIVRRAERLY
jgi:hypothetical protein